MSRLRDRLKRLEDQLTPRGRIFVFLTVEEPDIPPYAEQLAAFKAEKGVGPHDTLHTMILTSSDHPQGQLHTDVITNRVASASCVGKASYRASGPCLRAPSRLRLFRLLRHRAYHKSVVLMI